jgi:hypothetical protein
LIESYANSSAVFDSHGLGSFRRWGSSGISTDETSSDGGAAGLRQALQQLGGLYAGFARFLAWRADLLDASYISELRRVRIDPPAVPPTVVAAIIRRELAAGAEELASNLPRVPAWNTLYRTPTFHLPESKVYVQASDRAEERFAELKGSFRWGRLGVLLHPLWRVSRIHRRRVPGSRKSFDELGLHRGETRRISKPDPSLHSTISAGRQSTDVPSDVIEGMPRPWS